MTKSAMAGVRRRALVTSLLLAPAVCVGVVTGCGEDAGEPGPKDAGGDVLWPDRELVDTAVPSPDPRPAQLARGKYLVDHVAGCADCHTPRLPDGGIDQDRYLAGDDCFLQMQDAGDGGCVLSSANLTAHETGLSTRTDAEIRAMFMDGKRPDGRTLAPVMPYFVFHNLSDGDADAIIAYLRTVAGVEHVVAAPAPPFDQDKDAAPPIDPATIPATDAGASAERGRYLAAMAGACLVCHTPEAPPGSDLPIDMTRAFAGNRVFPVGSSGDSSVRSANLTPHETGLAGWTVKDVVRVLKQGKDRDGGGVCSPMPVGPTGAFGGLSDQDALDIATYILSLAPVDEEILGGNGSCVASP